MHQGSPTDLAGKMGGKVINEASLFRLPVIEKKEDRILDLGQHIVGGFFPVRVTEAEPLADIVFSDAEMNSYQRTSRIFGLESSQFFVYRGSDTFWKSEPVADFLQIIGKIAIGNIVSDH